MRFVAALLSTVLMVAPADAAPYFLYAGTYTSGTSKGIYAWKFASKSGALSPLGLMAQTAQPAHLWAAPNGKTLYTVNWETDGGVSAYRINAHTGALTFLNKTNAHGAQPNQVMVDPSGRVAVVVNYAGGSMAAYKLEPDGKLGEAFYVDQHDENLQMSAKETASANKSPRSKQHGIQFSKDNKTLFITDLGLDRVYSYDFNAAAPSVTPGDPPYVSTHIGAGPRRIQMSPDGRHLYVNHETDSEVEVFAIDGGRLTSLQTLPTVPDAAKARNTTAEILLSADSRHLYVANRGHDSIAIYRVDRQTGLLTLLENVASGGNTPRNIRFDPTGDWFFAANEKSGDIAEFRVDKASGHLTPTGVTVPINTPGGLIFLKAR